MVRNRSILILSVTVWVTFTLVVLWRYIEARWAHLGRVPRPVAVQEIDLGPLRTLSGRTASGVEVSLTVRSYHGHQIGFWGSETSPPHNVLWALELVPGEEEIQIPSEYLWDLAQIAGSPRIKTIEDLNAVNPERLRVCRQGDGCRLSFEAGDGATSYTASFDIRQGAYGGVSVVRTVEYHMELPWWY